ncbi:hypothetical protein K443DRAFT_11740 [Laccaria amethystina LaAM-08-1]|uniref:G domain-containing protein n=1 Tax=Laccaria amethystina LaAM-08-1 TaxID=1095629 RepID=A0A0C9XB63_9AGAR|nr:hypothetical protein K443DRAFT_11740 [Laccaria amethystina LaAM-08-1]
MKKPDLKFRVLIIGRANAGKTSILKRVCDTTESPEIYRNLGRGKRERVQLDSTTERGEHNITDELTFTKHDGYIFHDSCGFESGSEEELKVVQTFVREKSTEKRLRNRLHAIWYCIPMDNRRPSLDLKYFNDVCPDRNVPLIAVFTKYDQFKDNIEIRLKRGGGTDWETKAPAEAERVFQEEYLGKVGGMPDFVRLEGMHEAGKRCTELLEKTANALNDNVVTVMLLAVQRGNLELSVSLAVKK